MIVHIDLGQGSVAVSAAEDLKRLSARVTGSGDLAAVLGAFGAPVGDGEHIWVDVAALEALAGRSVEDRASWSAAFGAMIDYAAGKGWTDAGKTRVRVHVEAG